jgi:predicted RNase H-like HicB family nuclease
MKIKVLIWQENDIWCGSVPALLGCHTWAQTEEELMAMLEDAISGWLEVASQNHDSEVSLDRKLVELSL